MNIATMTTKAKTYGRRDLYILAMGTIEAIAETDYYTPESKVHLIRETVNALSHVRADESLPWHAKRLPATESLEKIALLNNSTTQTLEEILRSEA